ncbi:putative bifunctional diguanylate cyclase/phosphodiesterase [Pantoea vagans]|uniref:putative bifunctional diguanylate cyclase/phosphodiesterase n=1 Tax=Pantoea vagans TaxID=470934 RepID=UPI0023B1B18B|nr:EAL domain-containing protein [Pantoea vagans]MDE8559278.1 EAL domain-containing protein [Pantoea vagans]MDE8579278.1 EAL domain-containing protein [Pantoea vagans]
MKSVTNYHLGAAVSDMTLCAVYLLSAAGEVLSWNRGARLIKGWDSRDITGLHFSVFYDDEERARGVPQANLAAAREHGRFAGEGWRLRRDGSVFRASIEIEFLSPDGDDEAAFIKIVRDITPDHQARTALHIAQQVIIRRDAELSDAGRLLDEVFSRTPCALILCDAELGDLIRVNPMAAHSPWLRRLVLSGNILKSRPADLTENLAAAFRRGLNLLPGDGFSETLSSGEPVPDFAFRLNADRFTAGSADDTVLFTLLDVTAEHQAVATATHMAQHDPLTGLLNRRGLMPAIDALLQTGTPFAVMMSDIDRFKSVNDVLGHPAGDALLTGVAGRLRSSLRPEDILARTGGDEFVAIFPGVDTPEAAGETASRLAARLREPFMLEGRKVISGCSFGVCLFPGHAADAEGMLTAADIALYAAKSGGRNGWVIFTDQLAATAAERFSLENDLRGAIGNGELQLFYQPVVSSVSEDVVSYEALLRWHHPVRGNVPPDVFIPLAEETGLIHEIGAFALARACAETAGWPGGERVAVNLSPRQFRDPQLADSVKDALLHSGLDPDRLELEITESALLENPEDSYRVIRGFRDAGIHVVLDDFGTGFSSLSLLRSGLFSRIKIDRSFVGDLHRDAGAAAIVSSVLSLCRQLRLEVTAEGVETPEQAEWLRAYGCPLLQGFLYGRPAPHRMRK